VSAAPALRADLASLVALLGRELHRAGVPVSSAETDCLARVLELCRPTTVDELYWCARVSLLRSVDSLAPFDALFALVFRGLVDIADHRGQAAPVSPSPEAGTAPWSRPSPPTGPAPAGPGQVPAAAGDHDAATTRALRAIASCEEQLTEASFGELDEDELRALAPLLHRLLTALPTRLSRRRRRSPRGDAVDVRGTLRRSTRSGGDPSRVVRRSRRRKPRRLVALLDVSASMEPFARAYLHLLWGAARAHAEVFVFGTRLTRLTAALRLGGPDLALRRAVASVPDWGGGTRIGHALQLFMDRYGRRGMAHGAVVLIVSDGWERDDPALLGAQMRALAGRAHRVVWVNPRVAAAGFAPETGGMSAALPFVDALVSGHSVKALVEVLEAAGR